MIIYNVFITLSSGEKILTGKLVSDQGVSAFKYEDSYLKNRHSISIDPVNLPLSNMEYNISRPIFGVFNDALPDDWGRSLLVKRYNLKRNEQRPEVFLSLLGINSSGALSFESVQGGFPYFKDSFFDDKISLKEIATTSAKYESGEDVSEKELYNLCNYGSSIGGAHPKSFGKVGKRSVIAKFNSFKDKYDIVALEAATLDTALSSGIDVPKFSVLKFNDELKAILINRFDIINDASGNEIGRNHIISMQTLLNASGYYRLSYSDMSNVVKQLSYVSDDNEKLYRQMVFNATIGNTDDHLKNFSMINDGKGYCLSPAYDILPNISESIDHVLSFSDDTICPYRNMLLGMSNGFFISREKADNIIDLVCDKVKNNWVSNCVKYSVPEKQILKLGKDIDRRLKKISRNESLSLDYQDLSLYKGNKNSKAYTR